MAYLSDEDPSIVPPTTESSKEILELRLRLSNASDYVLKEIPLGQSRDILLRILRGGE